MADVTFRRGVEANLPTSGMATEGCVYQSTDTGNMYVGSSQGTLIPVNRSPYYGTCPTQAGTNSKVVTLDVDNDNFTMKAGVMISVLFSNANTAASPTLNVNSKGAVAVKLYGTTNMSASPRAWEAGEVVTFVHNGSYWMMVGHKIQSDWNQADTAAEDFIKNKPADLGDFTNNAGYLTSSDLPTPYTLPTATTSTLGGIIVGAGLTISSGGVLSATGGGVADSVAWGNITGTLADQSDLNTALGLKANTADLASVAFSGSYNDLEDTPTIPAAQIQSDWNQADTAAEDFIKNKPTIPTINEALSANYGECSSSASTVAKTVTVNNSDFTLSEGVHVKVKFNRTNTAEAPTLSVNETAAKPIVTKGSKGVGKGESYSWGSGSVVELTYDGTSWVIDGWLNDNDVYHVGGSNVTIEDLDPFEEYDSIFTISNSSSTSFSTELIPADQNEVFIDIRYYERSSLTNFYLFGFVGGTSIQYRYGLVQPTSTSTAKFHLCWRDKGNAYLESTVARVASHIYRIKARLHNGTATLYVLDETTGVSDTVTANYDTTNVNTFPSGSNLRLFAGTSSNYYCGSGTGVYSVKMDCGGKPMLNYIPMLRKSDGKVGFLDTVTNSFLSSSSGNVAANKLNAGSLVDRPDNHIIKVSSSVDDSNFVHKTGNENISGTKTFNSNVVLGINSNLVIASAQDEGVYLEANTSSGGQQALTFASLDDDSAVRLENVAAPVNETDAANKAYVDASVCDGNNYVTINGYSDSYGIHKYSLCAFAAYQGGSTMCMTSFTTTSGAGAKSPILNKYFPIGCKIYYHDDGTDFGATTSFTSKRFFSTHSDVDARYSDITGANISLGVGAGSSVYLRVMIVNGFWAPYYKSGNAAEIIVTSNQFVSGECYIYLGKTVGSTGYKFQLEDNNPLYFYDGENLIEYNVHLINEYDGHYVHLSGNETIAGAKTFVGTCIVPAPSSDNHASTKKYVDDIVGDIETILESI